MNDQDLIRAVRSALDASVEHVPYRAAERLAAARSRALAARRSAHPAPAQGPTGGVAQARSRTADSTGSAMASAPARSAAARRVGAATGERPRVRTSRRSDRRWLVTAVPAMLAALMVVGLFIAQAWHERREVAEVASVDVAVLTDELPIAAYADRGFGVYLVNTRR